MNTANCTLSSFQSETIAFRQNKNAPPVQSEGALFCLNAGNTQFLKAIGNGIVKDMGV